ncbi:MAG TPA: winged helix-turn-helix transcriptional regulator [Anaerolineae bacterium]|nr:winged helix-turn-helix transcriptional regulator [Anaerolineae bacterium]
MLKELLQLVARGGTRTRAELARELGVSEGLVEQMLEDLARMGYLKPVEGGCASQCAACPLARTCAAGTPTRVWALTEKGLHE